MSEKSSHDAACGTGGLGALLDGEIEGKIRHIEQEKNKLEEQMQVRVWKFIWNTAWV